MFSNYDFILNNEVVHTSNNLYAQKKFLETELSHTEGCVKTKLANQNFSYEVDPSSIDNDKSNNDRRLPWTEGSQSRLFYGKLVVNFFQYRSVIDP